MNTVSQLATLLGLHVSKVEVVDEFVNRASEIWQSDMSIPKTYQQAMKSTFSDEWLEAMTKELTGLQEKDAVTVVVRPKGIKILGTRWVFDIKLKADNTIEELSLSELKIEQLFFGCTIVFFGEAAIHFF